MLTIIGGNWRGRKLRVPRSDKVRPSSSKVRGALFNILDSMMLKRTGSKDFTGLACLDICAGSGALGFEALSRGAARAVFVEKSREHARIIEENMRELGAEAQCEILCAPASTGTPRAAAHGPFGIIFADPPYNYDDLNGLVAAVAEPGILGEAGIFVLEHGPKTKVETPPGLLLHSHRLLGPAAISVFTRHVKGDM